MIHVLTVCVAVLSILVVIQFLWLSEHSLELKTLRQFVMNHNNRLDQLEDSRDSDRPRSSE